MSNLPVFEPWSASVGTLRAPPPCLIDDELVVGRVGKEEEDERRQENEIVLSWSEKGFHMQWGG